MQKNALTVTVATLVMGIFGAFLRWLQNTNIYEKDTGLAIPGTAISAAVVIFSLAMLAVILGIVLIWLRRWEAPRDGEEALRTETVLPTVLAWICCAVFALGGVQLMFSAGETGIPMMQRLFGAVCIAAGACLPVFPARRIYENVSIVGHRITSVIVTLFFCFWLIVSYRSNAQVPALWSYAPEILAIAASTMAFYYITGWFYGRVKPRTTLVWVLLAVYLDISVLPDDRRTVLKAMLAATAALLLTLEYLLVKNMTERAEAEK